MHVPSLSMGISNLLLQLPLMQKNLPSPSPPTSFSTVLQKHMNVCLQQAPVSFAIQPCQHDCTHSEVAKCRCQAVVQRAGTSLVTKYTCSIKQSHLSTIKTESLAPPRNVIASSGCKVCTYLAKADLLACDARDLAIDHEAFAAVSTSALLFLCPHVAS